MERCRAAEVRNDADDRSARADQLVLDQPGRVKRAFDTAGMSLVSGMRNFLSDLWNNGGMPQQVDKRPFQVGGDLAISPGAVVYRTPLFELIQYAPATRRSTNVR